MDIKNMQASIWIILFVALIFVPGSTLNAIESAVPTTISTKSSNAVAKETARVVTTKTATSLQDHNTNDSTFLRIQSTSPTIKYPTITTSISKVAVGKPIEVAATYNSTFPTIEPTLKPTNKTKNLSFLRGTRDSLFPSITENDLTTTKASPAVAVEITKHVTIDTKLLTTETSITTNKRKIWKNDDSSNSNGNNNQLIGRNVGNSNNNKFEVRKFTENVLEQNAKPLLLPKPKTSNDHESYKEENLMLLQKQELKMQLKMEYTRQVQQFDAITQVTSTTSPAVRHDELSTAVEHLNNKVARNETVTTNAATATSTLSAENANATAQQATTTLTPTAPTTTTRRAMPTTTLRPTPPIDDFQTIISQAGTHAYLPCNVKQLVKKPISWLRVRDGHILTVDQTTFIADQRFQSIYTPNPERWSLQIKYVQLKDAGTYECQVSTEPKASAIVSLRIIEPKTELIGESTRHVKAGSEVKLLCIISQALEPPLFTNWFFNQKQIYLHNRKGWRTEVERIELPPDPTTTTTTTTSTSTSASTPTTTTTAATTSIDEAETSTVTEIIYSSSTMPTSVNDSNSTDSLISTAAAIFAESTSVTPATTTTTAAATTTTIATTTEPTTSTTTETTTPAFVWTEIRHITIASLIIPSVEKQDSGNYTCSPSNSAPRTIALHVLNGEYSASAITSGVSGNLIIADNKRRLQLQTVNLVALLLLFWISKFYFQFGKNRMLEKLKMEIATICIYSTAVTNAAKAEQKQYVTLPADAREIPKSTKTAKATVIGAAAAAPPPSAIAAAAAVAAAAATAADTAISPATQLSQKKWEKT